MKRVPNSLGRVAFLTQSGCIPAGMIVHWMSPMVVEAWAKLERHVDLQRRRRHEPDYYEQARELAEQCVEYRSRNVPDAKIAWLDGAL